VGRETVAGETDSPVGRETVAGETDSPVGGETDYQVEGETDPDYSGETLALISPEKSDREGKLEKVQEHHYHTC
jgi:hypothetical protein